MGPFDIIVISIVGAAVIAVIGVAIYKKVKGKSGGCCGCDCCCCSSKCDKNKK